MNSEAVIERVRRVAAVRTDPETVMADLESALSDVRTIRAFCDSAEADIARRIAAASSFPESALAEASRDSLGAASRTMDRSRTLDSVPGLAGALDAAEITSGHVDVVTRGAKGLEPAQRQRLFERVEEWVDVAARATVEQFGRRVRTEVKRIAAADEMDRLKRQQRATTMSTWTDDDGMWNVRGRFDPVTALSVSAALDRAVESLFAESVPETCPSDPIEKQKHLRALAFARSVDGGVAISRPGRPEFVAVIELSEHARHDGDGVNRSAGAGRNAHGQRAAGHEAVGPGGGPEVTWPIPIDVPVRVLAEMISDADVHTVVTRNGVVLHAPGNLDLGRRTRLANRAQRRALRGLYSSCAIPGCSVSYDRCKLHHIVWWRHGGRTDLENLLPVCSHHHHKIHDDAWIVTFDADRRLTVTFPDGTVRNTGPPVRHAA